jgi:hypothetical protein
MTTCGVPSPDGSVSCLSDHDSETPPQDHFHPKVGCWPNPATDAWLAAQSSKRRSSAQSRRRVMLEASAKAQPDRRVGPPVLDPAQARANADEGVARADAGLDPAWKQRAREAIEQVAQRQATVHVDDVWELLGEDNGQELRALGAVFRRAERDRVIAMTDRARRTNRVNSNHHWRPIWCSLVYSGAPEVP